MKTVAVFGAMYFELKPLLRRCRILQEWKKKQTHIFQAVFKDTSIYIVRTGVGVKNADKGGRRLLEIIRPECGLSVGLCGALTPETKVSETLSTCQVVDIESKRKISSNQVLFGFSQAPLILTGNRIFDKNDKKEVLLSYPEAKGCDMESAAIATVFDENNLPFAAIRTVSDPWDWEFPPEEILMEQNRWRMIQKLWAHSPRKFLREFFRLIWMGWWAKKAVKKNIRFLLKKLEL